MSCSLMQEHNNKGVGLTLRAFSFIIDTFICLLVFTAITLFEFYLCTIQSSILFSFFDKVSLGFSFIWYVVVVLLTIFSGYYTYFWSYSNRGTLGERIFGINIRNVNGEILNFTHSFRRFIYAAILPLIALIIHHLTYFLHPMLDPYQTSYSTLEEFPTMSEGFAILYFILVWKGYVVSLIYFFIFNIPYGKERRSIVDFMSDTRCYYRKM